jgi:hypothetical protein
MEIAADNRQAYQHREATDRLMQNIVERTLEPPRVRKF